MPASMPDAGTLLDAAIKYLEEELLPALNGYHRFKTRVTTNVLITLKRELERGLKQADDEQKRLVALLGHDGDVASLSVELAELLRRGMLDPQRADVRSHVRKSLWEALLINNPKWLPGSDG